MMAHLRRVDFPAPRKPQMMVRGMRGCDTGSEGCTSKSCSIKVLIHILCEQLSGSSAADTYGTSSSESAMGWCALKLMSVT